MSDQSQPANAAHRRDLLRGIGLSIGAAGIAGMAAATQANAAQANAAQTTTTQVAAASLEPASAATLAALTARLAAAPRRRDFKTVPMILDNPDQWDSQALNEVIAYHDTAKQVWDNKSIDGPWLNLMRNALNAQVYSFKNKNTLLVSATHGPAHWALYDQYIWDKYGLAAFTKGKFASNTLIGALTSATPGDINNQSGPLSPAGSNIAVLQHRGVVFVACHNAIWEFSGALLKKGANPDKLSHETLAAELTNHLIPGAVLSPGVVAAILQMQMNGFHYIAS